MPAEWYVYTKDQQQGPYTWEQLWEQARSGVLQPSDQVWTEELSGWTRADQVPGLTSVPPSAETPPPPPPIGVDAGPPTAAPGPQVAQGLARGRGSTWKVVAALAGAALLLTCSCGGGYLLLARRGGSGAVFGGNVDLTPALTRPTATAEAVRADEPTETTESALVSPTEPAGGAGRDEPVPAEPREGVSPTDTPLRASPTDTPLRASPTPRAAGETGLPSPGEVVDEFVLSTLGTVPGAAVDHDRARALMTVAYAGQFQGPEFVPLTYGFQDGPTSYEIFSEEIGDSTATVLVLAYWGDDIGGTWRFDLQHEAGLWRVSDIEILDQGGGTSAFWDLYPVVEEFTVYEAGGWKLDVTFDAPGQDIEADFRIEYRREDDGSLAYSQETSGVIEAGQNQMTLDSDWSEYELSQMGFEPGAHRVAAMMDGGVIAVGEMTVE